MSARDYVVSQFGCPRGPLGRLAGGIMARRPSNVARNRWTVSLLEIEPGHRVLEIGHGPGVALEAVLAAAPAVEVHGIDHSPVMRHMASRRNRLALAEGRLDLSRQSIDELGAAAPRYDRIFCVNTHMFWDRPVETLARLRGHLKPEGRLAVTWQPRSRGAGDETARRGAASISREFLAAGFRVRSRHELPGSPLTVCVIGVPDDTGKH